MNTKKLLFASLSSFALLGAITVATDNVQTTFADVNAVARVIFEVKDQNGVPVPNTDIEVVLGEDEDWTKSKIYTTNAQGFVVFTVKHGEAVNGILGALPVGYENAHANSQTVGHDIKLYANSAQPTVRTFSVVNREADPKPTGPDVNTARVIFEVKDQNGAPVPNTDIEVVLGEDEDWTKSKIYTTNAQGFVVFTVKHGEAVNGILGALPVGYENAHANNQTVGHDIKLYANSAQPTVRTFSVVNREADPKPTGPTGPTGPAKPQAKAKVRVRVIDQHNRPVLNAPVTVSIDGKVKDYKTDAAGYIELGDVTVGAQVIASILDEPVGYEFKKNKAGHITDYDQMITTEKGKEHTLVLHLIKKPSSPSKKFWQRGGAASGTTAGTTTRTDAASNSSTSTNKNENKASDNAQQKVLPKTSAATVANTAATGAIALTGITGLFLSRRSRRRK